MPMHSPPHPGRIVRNGCLEPLELTVTEGARALGVSRQALSNLVNGHASITPEMALRLGKAFDTDPELWVRLQANHDLAQIRKRAGEVQVERYCANFQPKD